MRRIITIASCALVALTACSKAPVAPTSAVVRSAQGSGEFAGSTMKVTLDRDKAEAGEPIRLTIETTGLAPPPPLPSEFGPFQVRPVVEPADPNAKPDAPRRAAYALSTLDTGSVEIPAIDLPLGAATEGSEPPKLHIEPIKVEIASLLNGDDDPQHYRDVKGVIDIAVPHNWRPLVIAGSIIGCIALIIGVFAALLLRPGAIVPELAAHLRALRELDALEAKGLPASGRVHEYYIALSDTVRAYVERRFGIRAPELTTPEFLREARRASSIGNEHQALLAAFLRGADMVKFAGVRLGVAECDASMREARRFVQESSVEHVAPAPELEGAAA